MRIAAALVFVLFATTTTPALASPKYFFGMGFVVRKAPSELGNLAGLRHDTYNVARSVETRQQALFDHDAGMRWRAGLELGSVVFVAVDTGFGVTALPDGPQMSAPLREGSSATMLGVAGLRGKVDQTVLAVELAGGFRHVTYCIGQSIDTHDGYSGFQEVAEVRVRGERWVGDWATLGATLGTSLIDRGAWVGALDITFHLQSRHR